MSSPTETEVFTQLGVAFDDAIRLGHLGEKPQKPEAEVINARRRVVGCYLFLLGYLAKQPAEKPGAHEDPSEIKDAIKTFQRDAGLTEDGWVGRETWDAVQELASFEHPINPSHWFVGNEPRPVLQRAAYLRLFAFGFTKLPPRLHSRLDSKNAESTRDLQKGLEGFVQAARLLRLSNVDLEAAFVPATLEVLFDQDGICERASEYLNHPHEIQKGKDDQRCVNEFLKNMAQIELWLYGYKVQVGNFKRGGPFDRAGIFTLSFGDAMSEFCTDHGREEEYDEDGIWLTSDAMAVLPWFFQHLVNLAHDSPGTLNPEDADQVVERVVNDTKMQTDVLATIQSLGTRLWDGIKRVGNWIKSLFKKLFNTVKKIGKRIVTNIARFIHESALRVYSHVVAAIRAVKDGVTFLKEKVLLGSHPQHMLVMHDKDLDFNLFVNASADPAVVRNLSDRIILRSEILAVGSNIVSRLLSWFISTIKSGILTGWFALILALVRLYKTVKDLKEFSRQALDLMTQLDDLRQKA